MAVQELSHAVDKTWKSYSTQEVIPRHMRFQGGDEAKLAEHMRYVEQQYQHQLARARTAFLQQFRNHSVVVESEVKRIRAELEEQLSDKYGEKIQHLQTETAKTAATVKKHREEIDALKQLAMVQEAFIVALRHKWNQEQTEELHAEIDGLKQQNAQLVQDKGDLAQQLFARDSLVNELRAELGKVEAKLERQVSVFTEEKKTMEERYRVLRSDARQAEELATKKQREYEEMFQEYKAMTTKELQIQQILNRRRTEALEQMDEERKRHIQARTKPTPRIGVEFADYELQPTSFETDALGHDTSWSRWTRSA